MKAFPLLTLHLQRESDVVAARQRARHIAELLGFNRLDQVRIATAVSEMARNAFRYAHAGRVVFAVASEPQPALRIVVSDHGPGIANLQEILAGNYQSQTGMGMGIIGTMRLMDDCQIETGAGAGVTVTLSKNLPLEARSRAKPLAAIGAALTAEPAVDPIEELQRQNQELMQALAELRGRQEELLNLTRELEDTNRGVVALYAEIDEKADSLRRADAMKSRFLANMSHEFRTPLGSIHALAQLLLERVDGPLTLEQEKQVGFIKKASDDLTELVNDLLDLAKIEAGKVEVKPSLFSVTELFSALRGMMKPLLTTAAVELIFEMEEGLETLQADEAKVAQILRNFISNALKFTAHGSVRVRAANANGGRSVSFSVTDTGIGIAPEDLQLIFEEFSQLENALQKRVRGTGLGLPLCRQLAKLLSGYVEVHSSLGEGSTFILVIPRASDGALTQTGTVPQQAQQQMVNAAPANVPVLVVTNRTSSRLMYEKYLQGTRYRSLATEELMEAQTLIRQFQPRAVVLDLSLLTPAVWTALEDMKANSESREIPVILISEMADRHRGLALGAARHFVRPLLRDDLLNALDEWVGPALVEIGETRLMPNATAANTESTPDHVLGH